MSVLIKKIIGYSNNLLFLLYSLLFIVTPFVVYHKTSELFEFNKMLFIYCITGAVLSVWILKMLAHKKIILKKTVLDPFILLFFLSQIVSTFLSFDRHTSLFGYYGRFNGGLFSLFCYMVLFYGFVSNMGTVFYKERIITLLKFSLISSVLVVLWGLTGWFGHDASCLLFTGAFNNTCWTESFKPSLRMFATLGQPNWLGAYLSINIFFCLYFLRKELIKYTTYKKPIVLCLLLTTFLLFGGILATKSRSAMLAVVLGSIPFFTLIRMREKEIEVHKLRLLKLCGLVFIAGIFALLVFKTGIPKVDTLLRVPQKATTNVPVKLERNVQNVTESFDIRKIVWRGALNLGLKYPLFGTGVETFGYSYYFTRPIAHNLTSEWDYLYNRAHNEYLNYFATSGFFGVLSYLLFIGGTILLFIRTQKKTKESIIPITIGSAWITILITNFFGFSTSTIGIYFFLLPALAIAYGHVKETEQKPLEYTGRKQTFYAIPLLLFLSFLLYVIAYFKADINYNLGVAYFEQQNYSSAIEYLERGLTYKYEHVYEDKLALAYSQTAVITNLDSSLPKHTEIAQKLLKKAFYYSKKSLSASSKNILYLKTKAKVYYFAYTVDNNPINFEISIDSLQRIKDLAPSEPKAPYTIALFYDALYDMTSDKKLKNKMLTLGLEEAKDAIKLKSNYRDAYFLLGNLQQKSGNISGAKESYHYILTKLVPNDLEAIDALKKIQ